jgi:hypothetical protein
VIALFCSMVLSFLSATRFVQTLKVWPMGLLMVASCKSLCSTKLQTIHIAVSRVFLDMSSMLIVHTTVDSPCLSQQIPCQPHATHLQPFPCPPQSFETSPLTRVSIHYAVAMSARFISHFTIYDDLYEYGI